MTVRRMDMLSVGVIGLGAALTAAVYERLPLRMATHFDLNGQPNGWMPREMGAWLCPAIALGLWALLRFLPRILPKKEASRLGGGTPALMAALTVSFVVAVHVLVLWVGVVPGASITSAVWLLLGAFYVALGLVLPRVKRNALIGIRTPWTLTSDENWARTQRVGGYSMVIGGIVAGLAGLAGTAGAAAGGVVAIAALIISAFVPAGYSLLLARRLERGS